MITELTKAEVVELGARNRAGYLLEQYGYTMGIARLEGQPLADLLPERYLEEVEAVYDEVRASRGDKTLAAEDAKGSTQQVNELLQKAKTWRRAITLRAKRGKRLGKKVPAALLTADGVTGVPGVCAQLDAMAKLAQANKPSLPGAGFERLIDAGKKLAADIRAVDAAQENKRLNALPESVRKFYYQKGLLYVGIKVINDAGRELHADDHAAADKYNLSILYRNTHRKKSGGSKAAE